MVSNDDAYTVSSSVKSDNLKEIWQLLDENENDDLLKSNEYESNPLKITGFKSTAKYSNNNNKNVKFSKKESSPSSFQFTNKSKTPRTNISSASNNTNRNPSSEKPKIRNYNIKS